jgi:predicted alpha/beta-fold hydrolase
MFTEKSVCPDDPSKWNSNHNVSVTHKNFTTEKFDSAPWCLNGHMHTIFCSLLFEPPGSDYERLEISTPDDDFLQIDVYEVRGSKKVVLLLHGLEGHSRRYYVSQLAAHLNRRGISAAAMNYRSCGDKMNRKKKFYHSGETEDLETTLEWLLKRFAGQSVHMAGFSLGASSLLNFLRKNKTDHPVKSAAAVSTPFELRKGSLNLEKGFNRLYTYQFLVSLKKKLEQKKEAYPELPEFNGSTLYDFDDKVTAPIHGFRDADHYYESCSSAFFMDRIKTPLLVIHSKEDPMCPYKWVPVKDIFDNTVIDSCFTSRGGHVGFWSLPPGWLSKVITDYFISY